MIAAGQNVTYSFVVTNTGNVTLTGVGVSDPLPGLGPITCPAATLLPGIATTCTATYVVTAADMNAGSILNTAAAHGTPPTGADVTDTDSAAVTAIAAPAIQIVKTANPTSVAIAGETVNYTFVVTNTGNVSLTGVAVTDPLPGLTPISCPGTTLAAGASMTCTASYAVTLADINAGGVANTASVTGHPPTGPAVSDTDTASVTVVQTPAISLVKGSSAASVSAAGQSMTYTLTVTNTGNVTLTSVTVTDPLPGLSAISCPLSVLAPGGSTTCTASMTVTQAQIDAGIINNTAHVVGTPPSGPVVSATDSHSVLAPAQPFDRARQERRPDPVQRRRSDDRLHLRHPQHGQRHASQVSASATRCPAWERSPAWRPSWCPGPAPPARRPTPSPSAT